ncbi:hypothetical protein MKW92_043855 [Papaver armeniacum]|nr:hypothetical protein MKW92_043855 [Papaver armeniacum]
MFKYAISTKMEVLNLSLGGPNYSTLLSVKGFIKNIISQEHGAYNLVEILCKGILTSHFILVFSILTSHFILICIGDIPNTEAAVVLPNEVK